MATEIKAWQIVNEDLEAIDVTMVQAGRKEAEDLGQYREFRRLSL